MSDAPRFLEFFAGSGLVRQALEQGIAGNPGSSSIDAEIVAQAPYVVTDPAGSEPWSNYDHVNSCQTTGCLTAPYWTWGPIYAGEQRVEIGYGVGGFVLAHGGQSGASKLRMRAIYGRRHDRPARRLRRTREGS